MGDNMVKNNNMDDKEFNELAMEIKRISEDFGTLRDQMRNENKALFDSLLPKIDEAIANKDVNLLKQINHQFIVIAIDVVPMELIVLQSYQDIITNGVFDSKDQEKIDLLKEKAESAIEEGNSEAIKNIIMELSVLDRRK